jgi:HAD superfamily hydrolase (TIGR01490 family)
MASAAFFDVDYTLISEGSMNLYIRYMIPRGEFGKWDLVRGSYYTARYKLGLLDFEVMADRVTERYAGEPESHMIDICRRWYQEMVKHFLYPEALQLIEQHRNRGDALCLLSAATHYLLEPMARDLNIPHYFGNRMETNDGRFTGRMGRPFCYGAGKILYAELLARQLGLRLRDCTYYSDSITDLEVLAAFGNAVAVNPDRLLRREAKARGWPILRFSKP